jgi:hypothetical protein
MKKVILISIVFFITIGIININLSRNLYQLSLIKQENLSIVNNSDSNDSENLKPCCNIKFLFIIIALSCYLLTVPFKNSFILPKIFYILELLYRPPLFLI